MGVPAASLVFRNISLSLQRWLKGEWSDPAGIPVGWNDKDFDPDGLGDDDVSDAWATVQWVSGAAGQRGESIVQVDVYSRVSSDPIGGRCKEVLGLLAGAVRGTRAVEIYDFSAVSTIDDTEVVVPGNRILFRSAAGRPGLLSDILGPTRAGPRWRATASLRISLLSDLAGGTYY